MYAGSGTVNVTGATLTGNKANVNGGGLWLGLGGGTMTSVTMSSNTAINGAALFNNGGAVRFDGSTITGNSAGLRSDGSRAGYQSSSTSTEFDKIQNGGGAVGVGDVKIKQVQQLEGEEGDEGPVEEVVEVSASLEFSGNVQIKNNTLYAHNNATNTDFDVTSNVYLNQDSDVVLKAAGLGGSAEVGIYVPGTLGEDIANTDPLVRSRGVPSARFATYSNSSNYTKFKNDRASEMSVEVDSSSSKLFWSRPFKVQLRYLPPGEYALTAPNEPDNASTRRDVNSYNPPTSDNGISMLADDIRTRETSFFTTLTNVSFGGGYLQVHDEETIAINNYVSDVNWNAKDNRWRFIMYDGSVIPGDRLDTLVIYYSKAFFLSIENNSDYDLYIEDLYADYVLNNVTSHLSILNGDETPPTGITYAYQGYGYIFAFDDAVQEELHSVNMTANQNALVLKRDESIKILLPNGQSFTYTINAVFKNPDGTDVSGASPVTVGYTQDGSWSNNPQTPDIRNGAPFAVTGSLPGTAGETSSVIFGNTKAICKIVISQAPEDLAAGSMNFVVKSYTHPNPDPAFPGGEFDGKTEYAFANPNDVFKFIARNRGGANICLEPLLDENNQQVVVNGINQYVIKADVQMLTDYMVSQDQVVRLNPGSPELQQFAAYIDHWEVTFSTAHTGTYQYLGGDRVTISRATDNSGSFMIATNGRSFDGEYKYKCILTLKDLIFDGKNHVGTNNGGIISTTDWNFVIDNCAFNSCTAANGGAIYVDYSMTSQDGSTKYIADAGYLTVTNTQFNTCKSKSKDNRMGGGAIWTKAKVVTLTGCQFNNCTGTDQGGALFHRIDYHASNNTYPKCVYRDQSTLTVTNCRFENCQSRSGGAIEADSYHVSVTNTVFVNCYSVTAKDWNNKTGSGGALATYIYEQEAYLSLGDLSSLGDAYKTELTVRGCTFDHCGAQSGSGYSGHGGAIRSHSLITKVEGSSFVSCSALRNGGAIAVNNSNTKAASSTATANYTLSVNGCTFTDCSSTSEYGGAIYSNNKSLTIGDYTTAGASPQTMHTTITNCTAKKDGGGVYFVQIAGQGTLSVTGATIENCTAEASGTSGGGGVYTKAGTVTFTDSTVKGCTTPKDGGGVNITTNSGQTVDVTLTHTKIEENTSSGSGGGLYLYDNNGNNSTGTLTVQNGSKIDSNIAANSGGGIHTNVKTVTVGGTAVETNAQTGQQTVVYTSVSNNQANGVSSGGDGGGIDHTSSSGTITLHDVQINSNVGNKRGGGVYTAGDMTLKGITTIRYNRLRTDSSTTELLENAAGVYLNNGKTLTIGETGLDAAHNVLTIKDNLTLDGKPSDLRLSQNGNSADSVNSINSVAVKCGASGEIRVVNAKVKGTQFGTSDIPNPPGFTDEGYVFIADDESVYGIIDRTDENFTKVIWGGDPICKITDANGRQLYLDDQLTRPCVYDRLDNGSSALTSAMSTLRVKDSQSLHFYFKDATGVVREYTGTTFQVKMLVESYQASNQIKVQVGSTPSANYTVVLTTETITDPTVNSYPYRGTPGTSCTIYRTSIGNEAFVDTKSNLTVQNITLDGGSTSGISNNNTRIINADPGDAIPITVTLGRNATLQNATVTGNGAGVYLNWGAKLVVNGGAIRNCSAKYGGAVYIDGTNVAMTMLAGTITRCTATENGGAIFFHKGKPDSLTNPTKGFLRIAGGTISRCTAKNGGAIYLNNGGNNEASVDGQKVSRLMLMSGGSIMGNTATGMGGGIYPGDKYTRIYFSGASYVYNNTVGGEANNVYLSCGYDRTQSSPVQAIIITTGLVRGATIGVYVPNTSIDSGSHNASNLYGCHGDEGQPFARYEGTNPDAMNLSYFVSDRDGYKGGLQDGQLASNLKVYWRKIYSLQVSLQIISDKPQDYERSYEFTVTIKDENGYVDTNVNGWKGSTDGGMYFIDGVSTFTLPYGGYYYRTADLLSLGHRYEITENLTGSDFKVSWVDVTHEQSGSGTSTPTGNQALWIDDPSTFTYEVRFSNLHAVCKITDPEYGTVLYVRPKNTSGARTAAVYAELVNAFNIINASQNYDWFVKTGSGNSDNDFMELSNPSSYQIEMLIPEYETEYPAVSNKTVTLTTAASNALDGFPYAGVGTAKIVCGFDQNSDQNMLRTTGALTLTNIILDGASGDSHVTSANGGAVKVDNGGSLTMAADSIIQNVSGTADGAAVYVDNGGTLTMNSGSVIQDVSGSANGAAVYLAGTMTMNSGSVIQDNASTGSGNGAGVYAASGGVMTMGTGAKVIGNQVSSSGSGAGVYLAQGSQLNLSGAPVFEESGKQNTKNQQLTGQTNGTVSYDMPRQDIFIAGYGNADATSLAVTGNLTGSPGSIWVWADQQQHYQSLRQFAVMRDGTYTGLNVLRNAQTDSASENTTDTYLFGIAHSGDANHYVYWNGPATVRITKTITGAFSNRSDRFAFTVTGLSTTASYSYNRSVSSNGTTWTTATSGSYGTVQYSADGTTWTTTASSLSGTITGAAQIRFELGHHESFDLTVPSGTTISVTEQNDLYEPSWVFGENASVSGASAQSIMIDMNRTLAFTNYYPPLAPTGVTFRTLPFALMLVMGLALPVILPRRRRREED